MGCESSGTAATSPIEARVQTLIKENKVMIFSKSYCPFCKKTKKLFHSKGVQFESLELDQDASGESIQATLLKMTEQSTVPSVFIAARHCGGNDSIQASAKSGVLKQMLDACEISNNFWVCHQQLSYVTAKDKDVSRLKIYIRKTYFHYNRSYIFL